MSFFFSPPAAAGASPPAAGAAAAATATGAALIASSIFTSARDATSAFTWAALIYRIEHENYTDVLEKDKIFPLPPKVYNILDGWVRESLPELFNKVLSLQPGDEKDKAKGIIWSWIF